MNRNDLRYLRVGDKVKVVLSQNYAMFGIIRIAKVQKIDMKRRKVLISFKKYNRTVNVFASPSNIKKLPSTPLWSSIEDYILYEAVR